MTRGPARSYRRGTAGLLAGPLLWLLLFFMVPVGFVAAYSVGAVELFPTDTGVVSLASWERLLTGGSVYMGLFWKSIRMSLTVSAVVVLLAYPDGVLPRPVRRAGASTCCCC